MTRTGHTISSELGDRRFVLLTSSRSLFTYCGAYLPSAPCAASCLGAVKAGLSCSASLLLRGRPALFSRPPICELSRTNRGQMRSWYQAIPSWRGIQHSPPAVPSAQFRRRAAATGSTSVLQAADVLRAGAGGGSGAAPRCRQSRQGGARDSGRRAGAAHSRRIMELDRQLDVQVTQGYVNCIDLGSPPISSGMHVCHSRDTRFGIYHLLGVQSSKHLVRSSRSYRELQKSALKELTIRALKLNPVLRSRLSVRVKMGLVERHGGTSGWGGCALIGAQARRKLLKKSKPDDGHQLERPD